MTKVTEQLLLYKNVIFKIYFYLKNNFAIISKIL